MRKFILLLNVLILSTSSFIASAEPVMNAAARDHAHMSHAPASQENEQPHYSGTGVIKAWSNNSVSIAHKAIPALHWPAMTMSFSLADYQGEPLAPGQQIDFTFRQHDAGYALLSASVKN